MTFELGICQTFSSNWTRKFLYFESYCSHEGHNVRAIKAKQKKNATEGSFVTNIL